LLAELEKKSKSTISIANEEAQLQRTKLELKIQKNFTSELIH
jgi:hypothetical protein